jgi:hypothetical protein
LANDGHQLGHQRSDTAQTEAGSLRMKKLILLNQTTPAQPAMSAFDPKRTSVEWRAVAVQQLE